VTWRGFRPDLLKAVQDQIESELELGHIAACGLREMLFGMLGKVRELVGDVSDEGLPEVCGQLHG
jgi:hypothetical protein